MRYYGAHYSERVYTLCVHRLETGGTGERERNDAFVTTSLFFVLPAIDGYVEVRRFGVLYIVGIIGEIRLPFFN